MSTRKASSSRATDDSLAFDALVEEVSAKLEAGEAINADDYAQDYPQHVEALRQLLPTLEAMADLGHSATESSADAGPGEPLRELGDFRIVREIGRGGMGVVYEAEQMSLGRRVALKVLPFAAVLDQRQLQRFKNEAQAAAMLHHQNIVPIYSVGCERGVHSYAMQFVEGQTLGEMIGQLRQASGLGPDGQAPTTKTARKTSPPTPRPDATTLTLPEMATTAATTMPAFFRSVAQLGIAVAEALDHAHQQGVVHRDIKPSNLMVDAAGKPWITDFGLARIEANPSLTVSGDLLGTLRYMSPEQALAKRIVIDHRSDIYSLGATLYELLTLRPVFGGNNRRELLRQIAFEEPRPPRKLNRAIPADLETILLKAMAKEPTERYATAQRLADDLRRYLDHKPIRARRPTLAQRAGKWCRRHKPIVWSAAALIVLAAVGLIVSTLAIRQEQRETQAALERATEEAAKSRAIIGLQNEMFVSAN
ncbi:MAG: serine/threonine protein kinase, partial [Candidatus Brocadiae bacterium]|nr:serine/threonine protein kinase [Candidatus Brocadiia bacterium]